MSKLSSSKSKNQNNKSTKLQAKGANPTNTATSKKSDFMKNLKCLKIQQSSINSIFLYYQRYVAKLESNTKYPSDYCAIIYYFNSSLDETFFYYNISIYGQIDDIYFGSYKKKKQIYFCIVKFAEKEDLNNFLDIKKAQLKMNEFLEGRKNIKIDEAYDPFKGNDINDDEDNCECDNNSNNKCDDDGFIEVKKNTSKNNFNMNGVSFKIKKDKRIKIDSDEEDEDSDAYVSFMKRKKKKDKDCYWNFQVMNEKKNLQEELKLMFKKDKDAIELNKKKNQNNKE